MVFSEVNERRLRNTYPSVGFYGLWQIAGYWIDDERWLRNEKEWMERGSVHGKLVDVGNSLNSESYAA